MHSLNANAKEWRPPVSSMAHDGAAAATVPIHSPATYTIKGVERYASAEQQSGGVDSGPFRCWHPIARDEAGGAAMLLDDSGAWNRSATVQLFTTLVHGARKQGDQHPCTAHGFALSRNPVPGPTEASLGAEHWPGLLLSFAETPNTLDWSTLVDAFLEHSGDATDAPPAAAAVAAAENGHDASDAAGVTRETTHPLLVVEILGYFAVRHHEYFFMACSGGRASSSSLPASAADTPPRRTPPLLRCHDLTSLGARLRRQLPRVTRIVEFRSILTNAMTVVSLPRASAMVFVDDEEPMLVQQSIDAAVAAVKSVKVARHLPVQTRVVQLPRYDSPDASTVDAIVACLKRHHCDAAYDGEPHPLVLLLVLPLPKALGCGLVDAPVWSPNATVDAVSQFISLLLGLLQQLVIVPGLAIDARLGGGSSSSCWLCCGVAEQSCTVRLSAADPQQAPKVRADIAHLLWPLPTSPTPPALVSRRANLPRFAGVERMEDLAAVRLHLQRALKGREAAGVPSHISVTASRRLLRSEYTQLLATCAALEGGCVAFRRPTGTPAFLIGTPLRVTVPEGMISITWSLYVTDRDATTVITLPSSSLTGASAPPDGGPMVLEGYLCPSYNPDQFKFVACDVVQIDGRAPPSRYDTRAALLAQILELDTRLNLRDPAGIAVVAATVVSAPDAFDALLGPSSAAVDYPSNGLTLLAAGATYAFTPLWWSPPKSTTVWFRCGKPSTESNPNCLRLPLCLLLPDGTVAPYRGEYCDVAVPTARGDDGDPDGRSSSTAYGSGGAKSAVTMGSSTVEEGWFVQCSLCFDDSHCHWWEAIRLCDPVTFSASFLLTPFSPLREVSTLHCGSSTARSLAATTEEIDAFVADACVDEAELALLLRAARCVCVDCGSLTDAGHRTGGKKKSSTAAAGSSVVAPYRCSACWVRQHAVGDCDGCGAPLVKGRYEEEKDGGRSSDSSSRRFFCSWCWLQFDSSSLTPPPAPHQWDEERRDWRWLSTLAEAARARQQSPSSSSSSLHRSLPISYLAPLVVARRTIAEEVSNRCRRGSSPATVIDLCCGADAELLFWMRSPHCHSYLGIDVDPAAVRDAQEAATASLGPAPHRRGQSAVAGAAGSMASGSGRAAAALRTTHSTICADCLVPGFWEHMLPRSLPRPVSAPCLVASVVTCFHPLPLTRLFARLRSGSSSSGGGGDDAHRFLSNLATAVAPHGLVLLSLLNAAELVAEAAAFTEYRVERGEESIRWSVFYEGATGRSAAVEIPYIDLDAIRDAAVAAGFDVVPTGESDALPSNAFAALSLGTRACSPVSILSTAGSAASVAAVSRAERYWAAAAPTAPVVITDSCEAFLRSVRLLVLRRRG